MREVDFLCNKVGCFWVINVGFFRGEGIGTVLKWLVGVCVGFVISLFRIYTWNVFVRNLEILVFFWGFFSVGEVLCVVLFFFINIIRKRVFWVLFIYGIGILYFGYLFRVIRMVFGIGWIEVVVRRYVFKLSGYGVYIGICYNLREEWV